MTPERFDPATQGELGSSSMTRQEGTAIFKGNAERRAAWERRQAIVSHPLFRMGQGDPLHDPVWGEQEQGSMRPIEHGPGIPHRLAEEAKAAIAQALRRSGQNEIARIKAQQASTAAVLDGATQAIEGAQEFIKGVGDWLGDRGEQIGREFLSYSAVKNAPGMAENSSVGQIWGRIRHRAGELEGPVFQKDSEAWKERMYNLDEADQSVRRLTDSAYEYLTAAAQAGQGSRKFMDEATELRDGVGGVNAVIAATPAHMADVNSSFAIASGERLPELIGQMGTLEDRTLAAVNAFSQLAAAPGAPTRAGGVPNGGRSARPRQAEVQAFLDTPPPSNLAEIFLDQFKQGHDMSGFRDADHWWEAHLKHVAQLKAAGHAFAQGTSFAPGGMALVGEMGPELVNLPRGSQVIPDPRLGSAVTVNVTVEGSVVAERDLAQRIRQELIRTSRRTVDLGFAQ